MQNGLENVGLCDFCDKVIVKGQKYYVYRLGFRTSKSAYTIGINNICQDLSKKLVEKGFHLSATQVILLRPDIMLDYLKSRYSKEDESVLDFKLIEAEVCENCYNQYKLEIPER